METTTTTTTTTATTTGAPAYIHILVQITWPNYGEDTMNLENFVGPGHAPRVAPKKARGRGQEADAASHAPRVAPSLELPRSVQSRENRPLASDPIQSRPEAFPRARKNANSNRGKALN